MVAPDFILKYTNELLGNYSIFQIIDITQSKKIKNDKPTIFAYIEG